MGVEKETTDAGDGVTFPKSGDKLKMHYTGTLADGGKQFDSSRDRGSLFEVTIGVGQVIKGWDEGVVQMSLGERAVLHISSDFGYGASGAGADIPPNADLDFDVRLVAINGKQAFYSQAHFDKFKAKLEAWRDKEKEKYSTKPEYREKKDAKHGGEPVEADGKFSNAAFDAFLDGEVEKGLAAVLAKDESEW